MKREGLLDGHTLGVTDDLERPWATVLVLGHRSRPKLSERIANALRELRGDEQRITLGLMEALVLSNRIRRYRDLAEERVRLVNQQEAEDA